MSTRSVRAISALLLWSLFSVVGVADQSNNVRQSAGFPTVDAGKISSLDVQCRSEGPAIMGDLPCNDRGSERGFYSTVEANAKKLLAKIDTNSYKGVSTSFSTGVGGLSALPVCNITAGEITKNWLPSGNSCGKFCGLSVSTSLIAMDGSVTVNDSNGNCGREYGWYRGARLQVLNFYKEKLFAELRSKKVTLVDINGKRPCAEAAAETERMQVASVSTVDNAIGLLGGIEKAAAIKCAAGAGGAGGKVGMDSVSVAACNLSRANMTRMSNWAKFLVCEMTWRTMKDFEDNFGGPDEWINSAKAQVQPKCQEAAYCEKNGQTVDWLCGDGTRSRLLNECYQAQLPEYLRSRMSRYATSTPVELNR